MNLVGRSFTGLAAWWVQRLSAIFMLAFVVFLLATFVRQPVHDYAQWHAWVGHPGIKVALVTFFAVLLSHMWVGLRDVLLDYAKPPALRSLLLATVACALVAIAASVLWILVSMSN